MIAQNAGAEGSIVVGKVKESKDKNFGYNAQTDSFEDLVAAGVIDPTKVTRTALQNAASIAGLLLTTECVVLVDQLLGYGLCLGDEPVRTYCMAVLDALLYSGTPVSPEIETFLNEQERHIFRRQQEEFDLILQTQVDFKLMEEE